MPVNNRTAILLVSAAAVVALIALVVVVYAAGTSAGQPARISDSGSLLQPRVVREDRPGYVIAELYQDVSLDVRSGVYDQDGTLRDRYWSHDPATGTCSVDLVLADQHGRDEIAPTATPELNPTPTVPVAVVPAFWTSDGTPVATPYVFIPTRTPTPDPPPAATPTPTPVITAATDWVHWKGRPVAIRADGLVTLNVPRDARVSGYLSVRTGPDSSPDSQSELARMPLPDARWENGSAFLALIDAGGRILLEKDAIDANYRSAALHLEISPLPHCQGLNLRWPRAGAVVLTALTKNPFADWGGRAAPPVAPPADAIAVYAAVGQDATFDAGDMLAGASSTALGHIVIPGPACSERLQPGQTCDPDNRQDGHVAFAVRADLVPSGLADLRQAGSALSARGAFNPAPGNADVDLVIHGIDFKLYVSARPWRASLLGGEWSLAP